MDQDMVMRFFLAPAQSGHGAVGEWRTGMQLYEEFVQWGGLSASRIGRMAFNTELRALGFAERREPQVMFFVPRRLGAE